jgi:hypothetical protein
MRQKPTQAASPSYCAFFTSIAFGEDGAGGVGGWPWAAMGWAGVAPIAGLVRRQLLGFPKPSKVPLDDTIVLAGFPQPRERAIDIV